jgi:hypothetical protein
MLFASGLSPSVKTEGYPSSAPSVTASGGESAAFLSAVESGTASTPTRIHDAQNSN